MQFIYNIIRHKQQRMITSIPFKISIFNFLIRFCGMVVIILLREMMKSTDYTLEVSKSYYLMRISCHKIAYTIKECQ